jgi:hypothetical protein
MSFPFEIRGLDMSRESFREVNNQKFKKDQRDNNRDSNHVEKTTLKVCFNKAQKPTQPASFSLSALSLNKIAQFEIQKNCKNKLTSAGIEPATFCVLDRCDNRYTTKSFSPCYTLLGSCSTRSK